MHISTCTSQNSTSIISSTMDLPSLPSSSSSSSTFVPGGPTLDRHNPIITDEKRSGFSSVPGTPLGTPRTNHVLQQKPKTPTPTRTPNRLKKKNNTSFLHTNKNTVSTPKPSFGVDNNNDEPSDLIMKAATRETSRANVNYVVSPPESSRYLLDDTSFLDVLSGFDPVLKLDPNDTSNSPNHVELDTNENGNSHNVEDSKLDDLSNKPPRDNCSNESSHQVVVLRVSLHCRGCEKKMKKHLSRLSGVTSFNIDFAAKKVTVVGDVTPLQVLASISKVKTAKLWSPTNPTTSHTNNVNVEGEK